MPTKPTILDEAEIKERLTQLPGWEYRDNKLSKEFKFKDFVDAFAFIQQFVPFFEEFDHHPDMHIFYSRVLFELQRFDVGGKVTDKDFVVAEKIEQAYAEQKTTTQEA